VSRILGRDEAARPPGVIDTLTAGYETINRRLWLLLFPIGLDLLFWLGPKLSVVRLAGYLPPSLLSSIGSEQTAALTEALARLNLAFLLALHVPTLLGRVPFTVAAPDVSASVPHVVLQVWPESFSLVIALLLPAGMLVAAAYLSGIGQLVRVAGAAGVSGWLSNVLRTWWRLVLLHLAGVGAALAVVILATISTALAAAVSPELASLFLLVIQVSVVWLAFYFYFSIAALIVSGVGPIRSALASVQVVRANFWPAAGFVGLIVLIDSGLPLLWRALSGQPLGLVAGIVGNAYVGTGLVAAGMLFFRDRLQSLRGQTIGID
jgi:hypothetical protein